MNPEKIVLLGGYLRKGENVPFSDVDSSYVKTALGKAGIPWTSLHATLCVMKTRSSKYFSYHKGEVHKSEAYEADLLALREELESALAAGCTTVAALGDLALYATTGNWGINLWRGSELACSLVPGLRVVPVQDIKNVYRSFAPDDYVRRSVINHDLCKALRLSPSATLSHPKYDFTLTTSYQEALKWLDDNILRVETPPVVAFDTEVVRGQVGCLSFAVSPTKALCVAFNEKGAETMPADCEARVWEVVSTILERPDIEMWMQNATFDVDVLFSRYGIVCQNVKDTMIAQGLINPDLPKNLGFICSLYSQQPYYKDDHKDKEDPNNWNKISNYQAFWRYNAIDSAALLQCRESMLRDLTALNLTDTFESHCNLILPILYMSNRGLQMNREAMEVSSIKAAEEMDEVLVSLAESAGTPINPCSPKQVAAYFYIQRGVKPYLRRDKKSGGSKESVDDDAMKALILKGYVEAEHIQKYRELRKYRGTYLKVKLDENGFMRSSYNPIGTTTGRLASSKNIWGFGTNLQNQPKEMRKFMQIPEGYIGFAPDLAGAETTCVANIGHIGAMLDAMERGMDLHCLTASKLFNVPYDEVSRESGSANIQGSDVSQRDVSKRFNHSGNYGVGYKTLAKRFGWGEKATKELLEAYHNIYPEVKNSFQRQVLETLRSSRRVYNCFGRSRTFLGNLDRVQEAAFAFPNQSTISDIINRWGLDFIWKSPLFHNTILVNQIHDSIEYYAPINKDFTYAAETIHALYTNMVRPVRWKMREFTIDVTPSIMVGNHYNKEEFALCSTVMETAAKLEGLNEKLRGKL